MGGDVGELEEIAEWVDDANPFGKALRYGVGRRYGRLPPPQNLPSKPRVSARQSMSVAHRRKIPITLAGRK
jgi:hypothetical protein